MKTTVEDLFRRYLKVTDDKTAAALLVQAHLISQEQDDVLTTDQVADRLGVTRETVQAMCARGDLKSMRAGRRLKIKVAWLDDYAHDQARVKSPRRHW